MRVSNCLELLCNHIKMDEAVESLIEFFAESEFPGHYICNIGGMKVLNVQAELPFSDVEFFKARMLGDL